MGGGGGSGPTPPATEKSQVAFSFLTPIEKQLDPLGPTAAQGRSVGLSVKYADDKKTRGPMDRGLLT